VRILIFNCGSSSAKFELLDLEVTQGRRGRLLGRGNIERIGESGTDALLVDESGTESKIAVNARDHGEAAMFAISWLEGQTRQQKLKVDATAHRIVHGGPNVYGPAILDDTIAKEIEAATPFAPLHNPPALSAIEAVKRRLPGVPAIVLTDTAFHRDLPDRARNYAIPRELARRHGIRRFGFHGIGHAWMMDRYIEMTGIDAVAANLVTLHLGAGCSATAIRAGKSVDTSMGLTPLEGLMMATRSGDLDPAIVRLLCERENLTPAQVEEILNHKSGLLGVSGVSRDVRDVTAASARGDRDAALAIEMFAYRARKYIGQYLAIEGRTRAILFGGGIGEHADEIRARICAGLEHLGIVVDADRNRAANAHEFRFSADGSAIDLYVIPLDEELYIARAAAAVLGSRAPA
jgi:acetate kinase